MISSHGADLIEEIADIIRFTVVTALVIIAGLG